MLISFNKLSVPSDVELVARNTMINLASLYTSHRWFLTSRFLNTSVMVQTDLVPTISLQYSLSVCSCTWNRIPPKSLSYHGIASLHSLSRSLPFAALRRRFSNFMYVLMNLPDRIDLRWHWWYNPITRSIFFCNEIHVIIEFWCCTFPGIPRF